MGMESVVDFWLQFLLFLRKFCAFISVSFFPYSFLTIVNDNGEWNLWICGPNRILLGTGQQSLVGDDNSFLPYASKWTHICVTYSGSNGDWKIYLNEEEYKSASGITLATSNQQLNLGMKASTADKLNGKLDEFYVFNRVLTIGEMRDLGRNGIRCADPSLLAKYAFDGVDVTDSSGFGRNTALQGSGHTAVADRNGNAGKAVHLSGSGSFKTPADSVSWFPSGTSEKSVCLWFKGDSFTSTPWLFWLKPTAGCQSGTCFGIGVKGDTKSIEFECWSCGFSAGTSLWTAGKSYKLLSSFFFSFSLPSLSFVFQGLGIRCAYHFPRWPSLFIWTHR